MDILLGLQWGDEGKGKIVDYLAPKYDVVARFQGGPNAGHTLEFEGRKHVLHQIPSGIYHESITNIIGNGVVLDPVILKREILEIEKYGHQVNKNLFISKKAHIILPTHRLLDAALEKQKGDKKIGSTLKGIGPVYQDKIGRLGLRMGDILDSNFKEKYQGLVDNHKAILKRLEFDYDLEPLEKDFFEAIEFARGLNIVDSEAFINKAVKENKKIVAEGAQGSLLDVDFGSYPFVTSSNTTSAGACSGLGIAPNKIKEVFGIFKAYCTRVGSGPFPTELFDETGEKLRKEGHEFGATTGRPRRCGWIDLPALKYAIMVNGVTQLFMMKADVLNSFEEIQACTHYEMPDGSQTDDFPYDLDKSGVKPVLKSFKGWGELPKELSEENLPEALKTYIKFLEEELEVPIKIISFGPDRSETLLR
ncbi:adenylosuccinate synthase [Flexithrix dorotheae]|uniref:adenylosuccinate synthase n=1 Tax=Flexithrix dorotheae TaxID=70993 RepID=UPI0003800990|nr:adenylosuccinate synthase [Flexithrix dorotheae]